MTKVKYSGDTLQNYYIDRMRRLTKEISKQPPKFDIYKLEPLIRFQERRLRVLHQMNEIKIILLHFNVEIK